MLFFTFSKAQKRVPFQVMKTHDATLQLSIIMSIYMDTISGVYNSNYVRGDINSGALTVNFPASCT